MWKKFFRPIVRFFIGLIVGVVIPTVIAFVVLLELNLTIISFGGLLIWIVAIIFGVHVADKILSLGKEEKQYPRDFFPSTATNPTRGIGRIIVSCVFGFLPAGAIWILLLIMIVPAFGQDSFATWLSFLLAWLYYSVGAYRSDVW